MSVRSCIGLIAGLAADGEVRETQQCYLSPIANQNN